MNTEQIINELEELLQSHCVNDYKYSDPICGYASIEKAVALIKEQERKIYSLENRIKECENGYEGTLYLDRCKLHDAEEKVKELTTKTEAQDIVISELRHRVEKAEHDTERYSKKVKELTEENERLRADTVRKMQERIKAEAYPFPCAIGVEYAVPYCKIDQIAKEIINESTAT